MGAKKVRVAIVGVGNCASSLVQGLEYYKDAADDVSVPGLMHVRFGDYHVSDVEVVAAFDVDAKKVGCDLADAIHASENNTIKIAEVPLTGVTVQRGPTLDGLGEYYREIITESDEPAADVAQVLRETGAVIGPLLVHRAAQIPGHGRPQRVGVRCGNGCVHDTVSDLPIRHEGP